ncbi:MAG: hypothetical protein JO294_03170, partial [Alphaproteobacteria bacterium]|nr:hypothetical protein [Alphaproteobacteria bacterium]
RRSGPCTPREEFSQPPELATLSLGSPDAPRLYALRCELRAVEGKDLEGALSDCNTALIFDARSARALTGRAVVYYRKDEPEAAMKDVQAALAINDPLSGALFLRGVLRAQAGDDASAYADFLAARTTTRDVAEDFTTFGIAP